MKTRELIDLLYSNGWLQIRMKGSHCSFSIPCELDCDDGWQAECRRSAWYFAKYIKAGRLETGGSMRFLVVIEEGLTSFGAYVPDLPGCIAVADTREELIVLIQEAVEFHLEGMALDNQTIPRPTSSAEFIDVISAPVL